MVRKKLAAALPAALVVAAALVAACAGAAGESARAAKPPFPVTLKAANGSVTIKHRPRRIVSLSPTATEDLFAVGAGKQVIAVDDQSNYPPQAPRTKLSGYKPNAEAVAAYRPDLVVAPDDVNGLLRALRKLRIPVLLEPAAPTLPRAYAQINQLGRATGHVRAAAHLVKRLRARIAALVKATPRTRPLTVYHEISPDYFSATSKTFIGRVYSLFGLRNIADAADKTGSGYPQLAGEYVIASNPDLIVLSDTKCCGQTAKAVASRPGWGGIKAVKNGEVVPVNDDIASRWGPRIVAFVRVIAASLRRAEANG
jgi:ABC-type Fe3+-hydroxamate transport system substrate-binding protein